MKLYLRQETTDRSLERRWDMTGAEPVKTHPLRPTREFAPVDLRIWWQTSSDARRPEACRAHAWPAEDQDRIHTFASWDADGIPAAMPGWVRDLAAVVRADLHANRASAHDGLDFWGYSCKRRWTVDGAPLVTDRAGIEFIPVDVDIWHSFYPEKASRPDRMHRYTVYARSEGRSRSDYLSVQWGGAAGWHDPAMPDWVRDLVDAQYADLASAGAASTAAREGL